MRMRFSAVECGYFVPAAECVTHLVGSGESGPAENEDAQGFHGFLREQRCRCCTEGNSDTGGGGEFDELAASRIHFIVVRSRGVETSLIVFG